MTARTVLGTARASLSVARSALSSVRAAIGPSRRINLDTFDPLVDVAVGDKGAYYDGQMNGSTNPTDLAQVNPWNDQYPTALNLTNATPANRPLVRWPFALFYQKVCCFFDAVNDILSAPAGTEASFKSLSDGTGGLISGAFFSGAATEQQIVATCVGAAATDIGIDIRLEGATTKFQIRICNGTAVFTLNIATAPGTVPINQLVRWVFWFQEGLQPDDEWQLWINGTLVASGTVSTAPSAANPDIRLVVGRQTTAGARFFLGWMAAIHYYRSPLLYYLREVMLLERKFS